MRRDALWTTAIVLLYATVSYAATQQTPNFIVEAPTLAMAKQAAATAEQSRRQIAILWLGHEMPTWYARCRVLVQVGRMGAGGATSFSFDEGQTGTTEVFGWTMRVQGPFDRIIDSVIPHEVTHTILACHFRSPLPRWADEGVATLSEDDIEKQRQRRLAIESLRERRLIPLRTLLSIREYPEDMKAVLLLYAQGFSLADYLVQEDGRGRFLAFVRDALDQGWDRAIRRHYRYESIDDLESRWHAWIRAGSPNRQPAGNELLAQADQSAPAADRKTAVIRGQSPESASSSASRNPGNPLWLASVTEGLDRARRVDASIRTRGSDLNAPTPHASLASSMGPTRQVAASATQASMHTEIQHISASSVSGQPLPRTRLIHPIYIQPVQTVSLFQ